jgi:hypothetical protein
MMPKYAINRKYAPRIPAPTACAKYIVLKNPMKVNAICQTSDTILCRRIGSMDMMRENKVFSLNMFLSKLERINFQYCNDFVFEHVCYLLFVFINLRRYSRSPDSYAFYSLKIAVVGGDIRY